MGYWQRRRHEQPERMDGESVAQERDAFAERLLRSLSGLFDLATIVIGDRLGLYRTLAAEGPLAAPELAGRTGTNERYVPAGMADQPSAETGTVMRADTLRRYATDAGFRSVEILPVDNLFFRLYRLDP